MALFIYYAVVVLVAVLGWPYTYGTKGWARLPWLLLGIVILALPELLPSKMALYYGLLGNVTVFLWSADSYMGRQDRRARAFIGGFLLGLLPALWRWPLESWLGASFVPTLGHVTISGAAWGLLRGFMRGFRGNGHL